MCGIWSLVNKGDIDVSKIKNYLNDFGIYKTEVLIIHI